jgi:hypothetical protein
MAKWIDGPAVVSTLGTYGPLVAGDLVDLLGKQGYETDGIYGTVRTVQILSVLKKAHRVVELDGWWTLGICQPTVLLLDGRTRERLNEICDSLAAISHQLVQLLSRDSDLGVDARCELGHPLSRSELASGRCDTCRRGEP